MRKRKISLYAISLVALVLASCKDYIEFDQNAYDDYVKDAFVVDNVECGGDADMLKDTVKNRSERHGVIVYIRAAAVQTSADRKGDNKINI